MTVGWGMRKRAGTEQVKENVVIAEMEKGQGTMVETIMRGGEVTLTT